MRPTHIIQSIQQPEHFRSTCSQVIHGQRYCKRLQVVTNRQRLPKHAVVCSHQAHALVWLVLHQPLTAKKAKRFPDGDPTHVQLLRDLSFDQACAERDASFDDATQGRIYYLISQRYAPESPARSRPKSSLHHLFARIVGRIQIQQHLNPRIIQFPVAVGDRHAPFLPCGVTPMTTNGHWLPESRVTGSASHCVSGRASPFTLFLLKPALR